MTRRSFAQVRAARDREIADWLDRWAEKARAGGFDGRADNAVRALASTIRAGIAE